MTKKSAPRTVAADTLSIDELAKVSGGLSPRPDPLNLPTPYYLNGNPIPITDIPDLSWVNGQPPPY